MNSKTQKTMKKKSSGRPGFLLALCSIVLLTAGCSKDSSENPAGAESPDARVALQLTGGISAQTRASDGAWDAGDRIGIYMLYAGTADIAEEVENIPYTTADGTSAFTPVSTVIYFPVNGSNVDFRAWYPYSSSAGSFLWMADLTDQSSQESIDLMTAKAPSDTESTVYNKEQPKVALSFQHLLTKLEVNIAAGEGISQDDLAGLTVQITEQVSMVTYEPSTDLIGYMQQLVTIPLLITEDGTFAEAILCPDDLADYYSTDRGRQLTFTLNNEAQETFYYNIDADKSFKTGEKNIYNITINRVSLDVTATVEDWIDGNNGGEDGSAE